MMLLLLDVVLVGVLAIVVEVYNLLNGAVCSWMLQQGIGCCSISRLNNKCWIDHGMVMDCVGVIKCTEHPG